MVTLLESQAIAELAEVLYDFLPASFSAITWPHIAQHHGVRDLWPDGISKRQAIPIFLRQLLESRRERFCAVIISVVQEGIPYQARKGAPVTREAIFQINRSLRKVQFKIPELNDNRFLDGLPNRAASNKEIVADSVPDVGAIEQLRNEFLVLLTEANNHRRGFLFEAFLNQFFAVHGLSPRGSFRTAGEQIDGSFEWQGSTYLVEARWRSQPANASDLLVLRGKAEKSDWTRGLFISVNGYTDLCSQTLQIGRKANLIAMCGQDLILILERRWKFQQGLQAKLRYTGETATAYKPLSELLP